MLALNQPRGALAAPSHEHRSRSEGMQQEEPSPQDILGFAWQIAKGMNYLEEEGVSEERRRRRRRIKAFDHNLTWDVRFRCRPIHAWTWFESQG
jgi:hypothetical protein